MAFETILNDIKDIGRINLIVGLLCTGLAIEKKSKQVLIKKALEVLEVTYETLICFCTSPL